MSCNIYISLLSYIPTIIPTTISPYPAPPMLPPLPQTPHIWQILLNLPQPYPTALLYLAQIPHSPLNICPILLSCISLDIPTTI